MWIKSACLNDNYIIGLIKVRRVFYIDIKLIICTCETFKNEIIKSKEIKNTNGK